MDFQTAFNILLGAFSTLVGWLLKALYDSLKDLQETDTQLAEKVNKIEVLVAGQYVRRSEFEGKIDAMSAKLDAIYSKLDDKIAEVRR